MDELGGLRIFTKVVEAGNFSAAARALGLRASSVSRQVAALEERLGVGLLQRSSRSMQLTEAGRVYLAQCHRVLEQLRQANRMVTELQHAAHGQLVVETRAGLAARLLAPALPDFLARHPGLRLQLRLIDHTNETLGEGVDAAIRFGLGRSSTLMCRKITRTRRVVFASPTYLARHGEPQSPSDLAHHNCLAFPTTPDGAAHWRFSWEQGVTVWPVSGNLVANDVSTLIAAAVAGLGICVLHDWMIWEELRAGRLVRILPDVEVSTLEEFDTPIYVVYPPGRPPAKTRAFIDFLGTRFDQVRRA